MVRSSTIMESALVLKAGSKVTYIVSFKVLRKYNLHLISVSDFEIDRWFVTFKDAKLFWGMDLEEFQSFFPRVTSFFLYKKLFSNKAILEEKDFKNHLPSRAYYRYLTPTLLLHEDFVAFQIGSGSYYRRNIAELFHTVEALERALTQSNFSMKVEKEKEGKNGN